MIIEIETLAEALGLAKNTLNTWLGHYTLSKYVMKMEKEFKTCRKHIFAINFNKKFCADFAKYIKHKHPRDLIRPYNFYEIKFEEFCKNNITS